jgi:hypothetical protein
MNSTRNLPLADELHEVRQTIRTLEAREAAIREQLLAAGPEGMTGDRWLAYAETKERGWFDLTAAVRHLGTATIGPFIKRQTIRSIKLAPRNGEHGNG